MSWSCLLPRTATKAPTIARLPGVRMKNGQKSIGLTLGFVYKACAIGLFIQRRHLTVCAVLRVFQFSAGQQARHSATGKAESGSLSTP